MEFSHVSYIVEDYLTREPLVIGKPKDGVYPWPSTVSSPWPFHTQLISIVAWHNLLGHPASPVLRHILGSLNISSSVSSIFFLQFL